MNIRIKKIISRRILPVFAASAFASSIYLGVAKADDYFNIITLTDVDDIIDFSPGYYEQGTRINISIESPDQITGNVYSDGQNERLTESVLTGETTLNILNEKEAGINDLNLGIGEQIAISPGYYRNGFIIKNTAAANPDFDEYLDITNPEYTITPGFYANGKVAISPDIEILQDSLYKLLHDRFSSEMSFAQIAEAIDGIEQDNPATVYYEDRHLLSSESVGVNEENPDDVILVDAEGHGKTIDLGVNEKMVVEPGYYNDSFTVRNGVADRGSPDIILDGTQAGITIDEGYYHEGTVSISASWYELIDAINSTLGTFFNGSSSFAEIAGALNDEIFVRDKRGTATYTEKTMGVNERIGTSAAEPTVTDVTLTGQTIDLGIDESITIPAGFYTQPITVQNGILHKESIDTTVSAFDDPENGGNKEVVGEAGYYDAITVKDKTPNGVITRKSAEGNTFTWDKGYGSWQN